MKDLIVLNKGLVSWHNCEKSVAPPFAKWLAHPSASAVTWRKIFLTFQWKFVKTLGLNLTIQLGWNCLPLSHALTTWAPVSWWVGCLPLVLLWGMSGSWSSVPLRMKTPLAGIQWCFYLIWEIYIEYCNLFNWFLQKGIVFSLVFYKGKSRYATTLFHNKSYWLCLDILLLADKLSFMPSNKILDETPKSYVSLEVPPSSSWAIWIGTNCS